jgi:pimeloyl-ACP methyl ester carboxylesterase
LTTLEDLWLAAAPTLSRSFHFVAVDRPGHGDSARARYVDATPQRQAEIIHDAALALGLKRPILLAHSFGGAVALAYAGQFPEDVSGMVALAPICFPEPRLEHALFGPRALPYLGPALAALLNVANDGAVLPLLWRAMFLPQKMPEAFAERFPFASARGPSRTVVEGEDSASLWPGLSFNSLNYGSCHVPVRILGGTADCVVNNFIHGRAAARLLPNAQFEWLPNLGHMIHHFAMDKVAEALGRLATTGT